MEWSLDDGFFLDEEDFREAVFVLDAEDMFNVKSTAFADREAEFAIIAEWTFVHSVALDLLPFFPDKFRESQILIDFVAELSIQAGSWLTQTRDIVQLLNPNTISSNQFFRLLGALIGVTFPPEDTTSATEMKKTILHAVEWYRLKGTYRAVNIIALISGLTVNLHDMYTNDYVTFFLTDWFVGDEDENPPGFDSTYYKSPHFGLEIVLSEAHTSGSLLHLWEADQLDNIFDKVEEVRPVHTVPHYILRLNPRTDEFGNIIVVGDSIRCRVTSNWETSQKFFDDGSSTGTWDWDDGEEFDKNAESALKTITTWTLGTGSYLNDLTDPLFELETPVLTGSVDPDNIVIEDDKITFEFIVAKSVEQDGITELSLSRGSTPMIYATFPVIDKDNRVELRVVVEVSKKDLS